MLDSNLIVNVVVGIAVYKCIIALLEFTCLKLLSALIGQQIKGNSRRERVKRAIRLVDDEIQKTELN